MNIEITQDTDELNRIVWTFYIFNTWKQLNLRLNKYEVLTRKSPGRNWKIVQCYDGMNRQGSTLKRNQVIIPPDVFIKVHQNILENIFFLDD